MSVIIELFGRSVESDSVDDWPRFIAEQHCYFVDRPCYKTRKSQPEIAIGTCTIGAGKDATPLIICPNRFLERNQVFLDCFHLLKSHMPGNEIHIVREFTVPGGSVDYVLVSARSGVAVDFVGIEFQALDTTGSVWPYRQAAAVDLGFQAEIPERKAFGINWKMTAKTILMQLHHKLATFEAINRHLVCVVQQPLLDYLVKEFDFSHVGQANLSHALHFHSYDYTPGPTTSTTLSLNQQRSTTDLGLATALSLRTDSGVGVEALLTDLSSRLDSTTRLELL